MVRFRGVISKNQLTYLSSTTQQVVVASHVFHKFDRIGKPKVSCVLINAAKQTLELTHNWLCKTNRLLKTESIIMGIIPAIYDARNEQQQTSKYYWLW